MGWFQRVGTLNHICHLEVSVLPPSPLFFFEELTCSFSVWHLGWTSPDAWLASLTLPKKWRGEISLQQKKAIWTYTAKNHTFRVIAQEQNSFKWSQNTFKKSKKQRRQWGKYTKCEPDVLPQQTGVCVPFSVKGGRVVKRRGSESSSLHNGPQVKGR